VFKVKVYGKHFYCGQATVKLSFRERLILALTGRVFVFKARKPGWTADLPFYIVRCKRYGVESVQSNP